MNNRGFCPPFYIKGAFRLIIEKFFFNFAQNNP